MLRLSTNLPSYREGNVKVIVGDGLTSLMYYDKVLQQRVPYLYVENTNVVMKSELLRMDFVNKYLKIEANCNGCEQDTTFSPFNNTEEPLYNNHSECCEVSKQLSHVKFSPFIITEAHKNMIKTAGLGERNKVPMYFRTSVFMPDSSIVEAFYYIEGRRHMELTREDHDYIRSIIRDEFWHAVTDVEESLDDLIANQPIVEPEKVECTHADIWDGYWDVE